MQNRQFREFILSEATPLHRDEQIKQTQECTLAGAIWSDNYTAMVVKIDSIINISQNSRGCKCNKLCLLNKILGHFLGRGGGMELQEGFQCGFSGIKKWLEELCKVVGLTSIPVNFKDAGSHDISASGGAWLTVCIVSIVRGLAWIGRILTMLTINHVHSMRITRWPLAPSLPNRNST